MTDQERELIPEYQASRQRLAEAEQAVKRLRRAGVPDTNPKLQAKVAVRADARRQHQAICAKYPVPRPSRWDDVSDEFEPNADGSWGDDDDDNFWMELEVRSGR